MYYQWYISGLYCVSCVQFVEEQIGTLSDVVAVSVSIKDRTISIESHMEEGALLAACTAKVGEYGYGISTTPLSEGREYGWASLWAVGFLLLFFLVERMTGGMALGGSLGYGGVLLLGVLASFSSCMALVGGLLLSLGSTFMKEEGVVTPQWFFHGGRVVSFVVLGGLIGWLGSLFTIDMMWLALLQVVVIAIMLYLGLGMLGLLPRKQRIPTSYHGVVARLQDWNHWAMPMALGAVTFFLPCGFTQTAQLYALSTGDPLKSAAIMGLFVLGTMPVLLGLTFFSSVLGKGRRKSIFYKTAGMMVVGFGLYGLWNVVGLLFLLVS